MTESPQTDLRSLTLLWRGPFGFEELLRCPDLRAEFSCAGVYLWKERQDTDQNIAYIGKAGGSPSLFSRHVQHYMGYVGGSYSIPAEFRSEGSEWSLNVQNPAVLDTIFDLERLKRVIEEGFAYVRKLSIYLAKVAASDTRTVERTLLFTLKPVRTKWGTLSRPSETLNIIHAGTFRP